MGSKFSFSRFGPRFGLFLVKYVWSSGFLEGFEWVWNSVLGDELGFEWVRISTCQVRSGLKFVILGFNPTLFLRENKPATNLVQNAAYLVSFGSKIFNICCLCNWWCRFFLVFPHLYFCIPTQKTLCIMYFFKFTQNV